MIDEYEKLNRHIIKDTRAVPTNSVPMSMV
jgi:hypothetical protein